MGDDTGVLFDATVTAVVAARQSRDDWLRLTVLPDFPGNRVSEVQTRNDAIVAAAKAGVTAAELMAATGDSKRYTNQLMQRADDPEGAKAEVLHEWGVVFGQLVRRARTNRGAVESLTGVRLNRMYEFENGTAEPTPDEVLALRQVLVMPLEERARRMAHLREGNPPRKSAVRRHRPSADDDVELDHIGDLTRAIEASEVARGRRMLALLDSGLSVPAAAEALGVPPETVRRWAHRARIEAAPVGERLALTEPSDEFWHRRPRG